MASHREIEAAAFKESPRRPSGLLLLLLLLLPPLLLGAGCRQLFGIGERNTCDPPRALCDWSCVDTSSDPRNCGSCGSTCQDGTACVNSACVPVLGDGGRDSAGDAAQDGNGGPDAAQDAADDAADGAADGAAQDAPHDGTSPPDGDGDGGGDAGAACGKITILADDFADGVRGAIWEDWSDPEASVLESGGELILREPAGAGDHTVEYASAAWYDLKDSQVTVEVPQITVDSAYTVFNADHDSSNWIAMSTRAGELRCDVVVDGAENRSRLPYSATDHRFWRISESSGRVLFKTSANGTDWTTIADKPSPSFVGYIRVKLAVNVSNPPSQVEARFGSLNGGVAVGRACPMSTFTDDFSEATTSPAWLYTEADDSGAFAVANGTLTLSVPANSIGEALVMSSRCYDLAGSSLAVEAVEAAPGPETVTVVGLLPVGGPTLLQFFMQDGLLAGFNHQSGTPVEVFETAYSPVQHRWWRMREQGGSVFFETSPDGLAWGTPHGSTSTPPNIGCVRPRLRLYVADTSQPAAETRFDNLNLTP
jgi:hypothetical protein